MGTHLDENGNFVSDKYKAWCPTGFVPLKLTDPMAHQVLWDYAERRESVDKEFSDDLREALRLQGYFGPTGLNPIGAGGGGNEVLREDMQVGGGNYVLRDDEEMNGGFLHG